MLSSLNIRGLTVVDSLDLDLQQGFTVMTGETGAGKSILLTAMGLALGERADAGYIRPGFERAEINLEFSLQDSPEALELLESLDLEAGEICIVRRTLNRDGRSRAFVNNRPVTLQVLQQLGETLIDIHGQHAHLSLLSNDQQRELLDENAGNPECLARLARTVGKWKHIQEEINRASESFRKGSDRRELIEFQIREMESGEIDALDYGSLVEEHNLQANAGRILSIGQNQLDALFENEQHSVNSRLNASIRSLGEISDVSPEFAAVLEMLNEAQIQIQESSLLLRRQMDSLESNPQYLETLEDKLALVHSLARKHQIQPEKLAEHLEILRKELSTIDDSSGQLEQLQAENRQIVGQYQVLAEELSANRVKIARRMQKEITSAIRQLGMPQGEFRIELRRDGDAATPRSTGFDRIEFLVTTNPGLPPRPLGKVASGGELSRISLAIQVASMATNHTPTMVFDEVDSGIGGGIAEIVGNRLRQLGRNQQVLCITHLPQVAAQSHHHLLVEKKTDRSKTQSGVRRLEKEQRIQEIARMLGGVEITSQTLAHAGEMLEWADKTS